MFFASLINAAFWITRKIRKVLICIMLNWLNNNSIQLSEVCIDIYNRVIYLATVTCLSFSTVRHRQTHLLKSQSKKFKRRAAVFPKRVIMSSTAGASSR
jgi:hypothetical protein